MAETLTLREVADLVGGELRGDANVQIRAVAPILTAMPGDLTWLADMKYAKHLRTCRASAVLLSAEVENGGLPAVACARPDLAVALVLERLQPPLPHPPPGVHPTAVIAEGVVFGEGTAIGPRVVLQRRVRLGARCVIHAGVFIGEETSMGDHCLIWPNVVIRERCRLGDRVVIHPNATIGADGFGFNFQDGKFSRIPQVGIVRIGDDVEIGANTCIDRAKCGETVIGRGTKIDNLVQIAHNVKIGEDCCIVAHAGVAGSAELGHHVTLAGKVGVKDNVRIGDGVQAAACSCIAGDIPDGQIVIGIPAVPRTEFLRQHAALRRLPEVLHQISDLGKRVERLEAADHSKSR